MTHWLLFFTDRDKKYAKDFADLMCRLGGAMGCVIKQPRPVRLSDDRTDSYMKACQENITKDTQVSLSSIANIMDRDSVTSLFHNKSKITEMSMVS